MTSARIPWQLNVGMFLGQTGASICLFIAVVGGLSPSNRLWLVCLLIPHFLALYVLCWRKSEHREVDESDRWMLWMLWGGIVVTTIGLVLWFLDITGIAGFTLIFVPGGFFAALVGSVGLWFAR
ncbi:MAG: hypothetical protein QNJ98_06365 [Planctomycetota bacterium]|nr:hypothetical protein [Planctomycetota bacterium]